MMIYGGGDGKYEPHRGEATKQEFITRLDRLQKLRHADLWFDMVSGKEEKVATLHIPTRFLAVAKGKHESQPDLINLLRGNKDNAYEDNHIR